MLKNSTARPMSGSYMPLCKRESTQSQKGEIETHSYERTLFSPRDRSSSPPGTWARKSLRIRVPSTLVDTIGLGVCLETMCNFLLARR